MYLIRPCNVDGTGMCRVFSRADTDDQYDFNVDAARRISCSEDYPGTALIGRRSRSSSPYCFGPIAVATTRTHTANGPTFGYAEPQHSLDSGHPIFRLPNPQRLIDGYADHGFVRSTGPAVYVAGI